MPLPIPWITDPREQMANQLIMRGHATVDQILTASFGEWPPRGLDIVGQNNQRVRLIPLQNNTITLGNGSIVGDREIGINRQGHRRFFGLLSRHSINQTLGHESVHIMQGDHFYRAEEHFSLENAVRIFNNQSDATSNLAATEVFSRHTIPNLASRLTPKELEQSAYFTQGIEIQARIHEVLIEGYPRWGRLPQNREELWVALIDAGLKPPPEIVNQLNNSPTIQETRRIFGGQPNQGRTMASYGLIIAQNTLTGEGHRALWETTLPVIYSDLIEMYGDRLGRARFGLGVNDRVQMRMDRLPAQANNAAIAIDDSHIRSIAPDTMFRTTYRGTELFGIVMDNQNYANAFAKYLRDNKHVNVEVRPGYAPGTWVVELALSEARMVGGLVPQNEASIPRMATAVQQPPSIGPEHIAALHRSNALAFQTTPYGNVLQIRMASKDQADTLSRHLVQNRSVLAFTHQNPQQGNDWVVEIPIQQAALAGLLPDGITVANAGDNLPRLAGQSFDLDQVVRINPPPRVNSLPPQNVVLNAPATITPQHIAAISNSNALSSAPGDMVRIAMASPAEATQLATYLQEAPRGIIATPTGNTVELPLTQARQIGLVPQSLTPPAQAAGTFSLNAPLSVLPTDLSGFTAASIDHRFNPFTAEFNTAPLARITNGTRQFWLKPVSALEAQAHLAALQTNLGPNSIIQYAQAREINPASLPPELRAQYTQMGDQRLLLIESVPFDGSGVGSLMGEGSAEQLANRLRGQRITAAEQRQVLQELETLSRNGATHGDLGTNVDIRRDASGRLRIYVIDPAPLFASQNPARDIVTLSRAFTTMQQSGTAEACDLTLMTSQAVERINARRTTTETVQPTLQGQLALQQAQQGTGNTTKALTSQAPLLLGGVQGNNQPALTLNGGMNVGGNPSLTVNKATKAPINIITNGNGGGNQNGKSGTPLILNGPNNNGNGSNQPLQLADALLGQNQTLPEQGSSRANMDNGIFQSNINRLQELGRSAYEVLGVPTTATQAEIRAAHRRITRQYHQQMNSQNPQAAALYNDANMAYSLLENTTMRNRYDQHRTTTPQGKAGKAQGGNLATRWLGLAMNAPTLVNPHATIEDKLHAAVPLTLDAANLTLTSRWLQRTPNTSVARYPGLNNVGKVAGAALAPVMVFNGVNQMLNAHKNESSIAKGYNYAMGGLTTSLGAADIGVMTGTISQGGAIGRTAARTNPLLLMFLAADMISGTIVEGQQTGKLNFGTIKSGVGTIMEGTNTFARIGAQAPQADFQTFRNMFSASTMLQVPNATRTADGSIDLTRPENVQLLRAAIVAERDRQQGIMDNNSPNFFKAPDFSKAWGGEAINTTGMARHAAASRDRNHYAVCLQELDRYTPRLRQHLLDASVAQRRMEQRIQSALTQLGGGQPPTLAAFADSNGRFTPESAQRVRDQLYRFMGFDHQASTALANQLFATLRQEHGIRFEGEPMAAVEQWTALRSAPGSAAWRNDPVEVFRRQIQMGGLQFNGPLTVGENGAASFEVGQAFTTPTMSYLNRYRVEGTWQVTNGEGTFVMTSLHARQPNGTWQQVPLPTISNVNLSGVMSGTDLSSVIALGNHYQQEVTQAQAGLSPAQLQMQGTTVLASGRGTVPGTTLQRDWMDVELPASAGGTAESRRIRVYGDLRVVADHPGPNHFSAPRVSNSFVISHVGTAQGASSVPPIVMNCRMEGDVCTGLVTPSHNASADFVNAQAWLGTFPTPEYYLAAQSIGRLLTAEQSTAALTQYETLRNTQLNTLAGSETALTSVQAAAALAERRLVAEGTMIPQTVPVIQQNQHSGGNHIDLHHYHEAFGSPTQTQALIRPGSRLTPGYSQDVRIGLAGNTTAGLNYTTLAPGQRLVFNLNEAALAGTGRTITSHVSHNNAPSGPLHFQGTAAELDGLTITRNGQQTIITTGDGRIIRTNADLNTVHIGEIQPDGMVRTRTAARFMAARAVRLHNFNSAEDVAFGLNAAGQVGSPNTDNIVTRVRGTVTNGVFVITHTGPGINGGGEWRAFTPPPGFTNAFPVSGEPGSYSAVIPPATLTSLALADSLQTGVTVLSGARDRAGLEATIANANDPAMVPQVRDRLRVLMAALPPSTNPNVQYVLLRQSDSTFAIATGTVSSGTPPFTATSITRFNAAGTAQTTALSLPQPLTPLVNPIPIVTVQQQAPPVITAPPQLPVQPVATLNGQQLTFGPAPTMSQSLPAGASLILEASRPPRLRALQALLPQQTLALTPPAQTTPAENAALIGRLEQGWQSYLTTALELPGGRRLTAAQAAPLAELIAGPYILRDGGINPTRNLAHLLNRHDWGNIAQPDRVIITQRILDLYSDTYRQVSDNIGQQVPVNARILELPPPPVALNPIVPTGSPEPPSDTTPDSALLRAQQQAVQAAEEGARIMTALSSDEGLLASDIQALSLASTPEGLQALAMLQAQLDNVRKNQLPPPQVATEQQAPTPAPAPLPAASAQLPQETRPPQKESLVQRMRAQILHALGMDSTAPVQADPMALAAALARKDINQYNPFLGNQTVSASHNDQLNSGVHIGNQGIPNGARNV